MEPLSSILALHYMSAHEPLGASVSLDAIYEIKRLFHDKRLRDFCVAESELLQA